MGKPPPSSTIPPVRQGGTRSTWGRTRSQAITRISPSSPAVRGQIRSTKPLSRRILRRPSKRPLTTSFPLRRRWTIPLSPSRAIRADFCPPRPIERIPSLVISAVGIPATRISSRRIFSTHSVDFWRFDSLVVMSDNGRGLRVDHVVMEGDATSRCMMLGYALSFGRGCIYSLEVYLSIISNSASHPCLPLPNPPALFSSFSP